MKSWPLALVMLLIALLLSTPVISAESQAGSYSLSIGVLTINPDGTMATVPTPVTLLKLGSVPTPGPAPAPTPTPVPTPNLTPRAQAIKAAAEKITADPKRSETAGQLGVLYAEIAKKVTDKAISGQAGIELAMKFGANMVLDSKGSAVAAAWKPTRDVMSAQMAELAQRNASDAEYVTWLSEVSAGCNALCTNKAAINMEMIMAIIKMVLEIIAMFS